MNMYVRAAAFAAMVLWGQQCVAAPAPLVSVESFYRGRVINLLVATAPAGRYDLSARLIARHLGRFIPGHPTVIVQNQPGGGGLLLANRLFNVVPRDGLYLASMQPGTPLLQIQGDPNAKFDPLAFDWIGSVSSFKDDANLLILSPSFGVKDVRDLKAAGRRATLGSGTPGSNNLSFALMARDVLGLPLNIVRGYPGAPALHLAMERKEIDGQVVLMSSIKTTHPQIWSKRAFVPIVAFGRHTRMEVLPNVPTARELTTDPRHRAILDFAEVPFFMSLPLLAPPGIPTDRSAALHRAFYAMTQDSAFRDDANKAEVDLSPIDGDAVRKLLAAATATPKDVIAEYNKIVRLEK